ncbi:cytochrome c assembly protein [Deinococcus aerius]|uniref:Cytochrome c assembly protein n=2 Tax=Deinococcus TaxID=1298 RepID=A0A2I9CSH0_9DEIO|nr:MULTISPECIES: heme lyase CcmF/NrfE family subunit [Deinococcus]MBB5293928.1 cytochrome c-type biogenesis protein CcmF [Deinococcus metallilatus]QBY07136.1 heme lyase CcmF/NrfE family subunit [Deinococcus metallilatus]RXJ14608.1 heme lyase CcmF/NrfE family subunit [Deinococcus metallilatus]TLK30728.1 heme lyase CcmF/NrfE family subunit [Deinococcus metallilatus]GBF04612.1 cytochrome c assembly protein [Deinococcus aerius]
MLNLISFQSSALGALGQLSLLAALAFTLGGTWLAVVGGLKADSRATEAARRAVWAVFALVSLGTLVLMAALLRDDFSVRYVAEHSMRASPTWVKVTSLWGALSGSILLWAWLLAGFALVLSLTLRRDALRPWALGAMFVSLLFFVGVCASIASPFTPLSQIPAEGSGPNPALQNHWMMAVHPVLLYLGFVGLSVPFAYAVAALVTGRLSDHWVVVTRRWTLVAWAFLTAAIVAGGWWSYETLGWGGYWAWDPVENASFIPWLLTTAFLHSVQIQERRGLMRAWNVWLIVLAYASTVLGTFLNRSGIVQSVHAFAGGPVGPVFLGFLAFLLVAGIGLAAWRAPHLRDEADPPAPVSREGAFLAGNWLFLVFAVMVLVGTLFPTLVEAVQGRRDASVGPAFYNAFAIPLGLGLLLLMGAGPLLPWRRADGQSFWRALRPLLLAGLGAGLIAFAFGVRSPGVLGTVALAAYNLVGLGLLTARALRERAAARRGSGFLGLVREQPRRYGAYLAHVGLVVIALGIAFSGAYRQDAQTTLKVGAAPTKLLNETLALQGTRLDTKPYGRSQVARVLIDGRPFEAKLNTYVQGGNSAFAAPAVRYGVLGDTYLVVTAFDEQGRWASVRLIESPLVSWIWWGTLIVVLGAGLTLVPPKRATVRVPVARTAPATD